MDVWVELADGTQFWTCRVCTARDTQTNYIVYGGGVQTLSSVVCVCSGYETAVKIWFYPQKNANFICGLGWTDEETSTFAGAFVHSDNVVGNPSSLSDERIKDNVSSLDPSNCLSFCNTLQPSLYLQTLANEPRTGLTSQQIHSSLQAYNFPEAPVLDTKMASVDGENQELMSMRYERLVPMLLGAVKELTNRITQLESQVQ